MHQGNDIVPIAGTKRVRYLEENVASAAAALDPGELALLDERMPAPFGERYDAGGMRTVGI